MRRFLVLALLAVAGSVVAQPWSPPSTTDLKFDDLFPRMPFFGQVARQAAWSSDDRYVAYLWNAYDVRGADLWVFDTKEGKTTRVTDIDKMAAFDPDAAKAKGRYARERSERDDAIKLDDKGYREWQLKRRRETQEQRGPQPDYPGPSAFSWSKSGTDMLVVYKGDLFRWKPGEKSLTRLTKTRDAETDPRWMPDGSGFYFRRGEGLYKMRFDTAYVEQIDPKLPNDLPLWGYSLSPDGTKIMVFSGRSTGQYRQIEWITYRGRFPQVRRTNQYWGTPDEKIQEERFMFLHDLTKDQSDDNKPWEVWSWKSSGDEIVDVSTSEEPWSPDSKRFAFASFSSASREVSVQIASLDDRKTDEVHKSNFPGEISSGEACQPTWTPDGSRLVCVLEATGYRLPWLLDPVAKTARPIVTGGFMATPYRTTPDGKSLIVHATAMDPARPQVYRVSIETGEMERLTPETGNYRVPVVDNAGKKIVAGFANWTSPVETYLIEGGRQKALTDSHRPGGFAAVNKLQPTLFTFQNRHGQTVRGYLFLPPGRVPGEKRPCMVYTYGGPLGSGKSVNDGEFNSTAYLLNMYLAYSHGYIAATVDPRGSSDYGGAFVRASFGAVGQPQTEDLVDAAKFLQAQYGADPEHMALNGWSFGGWQTQHTLYTQPGVYTLGIAGAGPTEWQNYNQGYTQETIGVEPEGSTENLDKFSLTKVATNLKHPLMILHGMEDDNVLFQHSIAVYRVLLQAGLGPLVEFVVDPTGGHGLGGDIVWRDSLALYVRFIQKHWGLGTPEKP